MPLISWPQPINQPTNYINMRIRKSLQKNVGKEEYFNIILIDFIIHLMANWYHNDSKC